MLPTSLGHPMDFLEAGKSRFWKPGNPDLGKSIIFQPGNQEIWDPQTYKFSKFKSVLPKMSARSGLVGKNRPDRRKMQKMQKKCLFSLVAMDPIFAMILHTIHPVWARPLHTAQAQIA